MVLFVCKQYVKDALIFGKQNQIKVLQSGQVYTVSILTSSPFPFNFENDVLSDKNRVLGGVPATIWEDVQFNAAAMYLC